MKFPEPYRWKEGPHPMYRTKEGDDFGFFIISARDANGRTLKCMATAGEDEGGWEHVSVSLVDFKKKCPSWEEMCIVKNLFWDKTECVVQFHPAEEDHISHAEVLHLWRSKSQAFPMPPKNFV